MVVDEAHEGVDTFKTDVAFDRINRGFTLHLSGTPFKALAKKTFPPEAIFFWTYADEQAKKISWSGEDENPYDELPQLNLFTYKMSDIVADEIKRGVELNGEIVEYSFDLNEFFATDDKDNFVHDSSVDKLNANHKIDTRILNDERKQAVKQAESDGQDVADVNEIFAERQRVARRRRRQA